MHKNNETLGTQMIIDQCQLTAKRTLKIIVYSDLLCMSIASIPYVIHEYTYISDISSTSYFFRIFYLEMFLNYFQQESCFLKGNFNDCLIKR